MKQPWLASPRFDLLWILLPPIIATLAVALIFVWNPRLADIPMGPWTWFFLVLAIDVSHVYASVYRTILSPRIRDRLGLALTLVPPLAYLLGYALYQTDPLWFWRVLAYLAVFHFVRQPYGLMMLYKRKGPREALWMHRLDQLAIYTASLYPIWCWHFDPSRTFHWFTAGDFLSGNFPEMIWAGHIFACAVALAYFGKEVFFKRGDFNLPKNLVLLGTAVSFGFGILYWNSDLAFTVTNVVGHGIAYLALVWWSDGKRWYETRLDHRFQMAFPLLFVFGLLGLAYFEEGLWDLLVWGEHRELFPLFHSLIIQLGFDPSPLESQAVLAFLVPLLALPQATHYIWDGFIWRRSASETAHT